MACLIIHLLRDKLAIFEWIYLMNCYSGRDGRDIHILTLSTKRKKKQKREINCYYFNSSLKNHYDYNWYRSGDCQQAMRKYREFMREGMSMGRRSDLSGRG